ncbi:hypothetical protein SGGBAA2069_c05120 [Streptococcus gallolyticus subsp. gallolyticus ATCC BAA-2069]|nr:hypothetical protein SGGBAA2069_c05120 [Streptococcus gallolyticus subsp. gallolyticus ATCC BAA-2069]
MKSKEAKENIKKDFLFSFKSLLKIFSFYNQ